MSFKESVQSDIQNVFLNLSEFAEKVNIIYDGVEYLQVSAVVLSEHEQIRQNVQGVGSRKVASNDRAQQQYLATRIIYFDIKDVGGVQPEYGQRFKLNMKDDGAFYEEYYIGNSRIEMGLCRLSLEKFDE